MTDQLELLAELATALLGFSGIVVSLGRTNFSVAGYANRVAALLWASALALTGALLPILHVPLVWAAFILAGLSFLVLSWATRTFVLGGNLHRTDTIPWLLFALLMPSLATTGWLTYCLVFDRATLGISYLSVAGSYLLLAMSIFIRLVLAMDLAKSEADA